MSDALLPFLSLADQLYSGFLSEEEFPSHISALPSLDDALLTALTEAAQTTYQTAPRRGWALAAVADQAAQRTRDLPLQARAAFSLAWAANEWYQPARVTEAVTRARAGFVALREPGWVAACDWQLYAHPWTRNDFTLAAEKLTEALAGLQRAGLQAWIPSCQLALAAAYTLRGQYQEAQSLIAQSGTFFTTQENRVGLIQCWLATLRVLRREGQLDALNAHLAQEVSLFHGVEMTVAATQARFQKAFVYYQLGEYPAAQQNFFAAAQVFKALSLPLWEGQCYGGLAIVANNFGTPQQALAFLQQAGEIYADFEVHGLRADNLLDRAWHSLLAGHYQKSILLLEQAEEAYQQVGAQPMVAAAALYSGEAYLHLARYQTAIHHLERAETLGQTLEGSWRQAECDLYLGQGYLAIGREDLAGPRLERAITSFRQHHQLAYLAQALNQRALLAYQQGDYLETVMLAQEVLHLADDPQLLLQTTAAHQYLGQALVRLGRTDEALIHLQTAVRVGQETQVETNWLASLLALGEAYRWAGLFEQAQQTWEVALAPEAPLTPGQAWQAYAGLAHLASIQGRKEAALAYYRDMLQALGQIRQKFWQPSLAGSYLKTPMEMVNDALTFTVQHGLVPETLQFIEESKAQLVAHQIAHGNLGEKLQTPELEGLREELIRLKQRLQKGSRAGMSLVETGRMRQTLRAKIQQYDTQLARLERLAQGTKQLPTLGTFELSGFRQAAQATYPPKWLALEYYQTKTHFLVIVLTATTCRLHTLEITPHLRFLLHLCLRTAQNSYTLQEPELADLGRALLPDTLAAQLTPETHLLLAPHGDLHLLPWPALRLASGQETPEEPARYLVETCIPIVVPSLHSFSVLHNRRTSHEPASQKGLVVAVSDFQGRHNPLRDVENERKQLMAQLEGMVHNFASPQTTWPELLDLSHPQGLGNFAFLHLATHAFHDATSTRLSGFALYDRDIWLENIWDLSPLPALVTLSACSGRRHQVYAGDEQVGLAITMLAAGAQTVIGSLWPVLDTDTTVLMQNFYQGWHAAPARALAAAQRQAIQRGETPVQWGSFVCLGLGV
jgi:CHAT domain-containing protein